MEIGNAVALVYGPGCMDARVYGVCGVSAGGPVFRQGRVYMEGQGCAGVRWAFAHARPLVCAGDPPVGCDGPPHPQHGVCAGAMGSAGD